MSASGGLSSPPNSRKPPSKSKRTPSSSRKSNADTLTYQSKIISVEGCLLSNKLLPTLSKRRIGTSTSNTINIPATSSDNFHFTTVKGDSGSCHAILVYVKPNDKGTKTVYYYDPAGKQFNEQKEPVIPYTFTIDGHKVTEIIPDMCPDKGINPEGYCALWSIVVVILWDITPELPFDEKMRMLQVFNSKIAGTRKVPGIRKWFIATIYCLLMMNRDYTSTVANTFIDAVRHNIQMTLNYTESSDIRHDVNFIAKLIEESDKKKDDIKKSGLMNEELKDAIKRNTHELDEAVNTYIKKSMGRSATAAAAAAAVPGPGPSPSPGPDASAPGPDADADDNEIAKRTRLDPASGGLRRARSLRRKNKMYRSKKLRKKRRTSTRDSMRNYRK